MITLNPEWVGFVAASLTTFAYMPQVIKVFREKHTKSISMVMYLTNVAGISAWILYGAMVGSPSILYANIFILLMVLTIIIMKIRYDAIT